MYNSFNDDTQKSKHASITTSPKNVMLIYNHIHTHLYTRCMYVYECAKVILW